MNWDRLIDTLMYFIPAAIALGAIFLYIKRHQDNEYQLKLLEFRRSIQKEMLPLRFQAFERVTLFLERISPQNLLVRVHQNGMTASQFQMELISTIRSEYEHNITQQVYMSTQSWEAVKNAKEEMVKVVNVAASALNENARGVDLSKKIFEVILENEFVPTQKALDFIKAEIKQFM